MAAKKKSRARAKKRYKPLVQIWEHGRCADSGLKLYSARVAGNAEYGPVSAPNKSKAKAKLYKVIRKELR